MKNLALLIIVISCIWAGLLLGISFLEAPLKFQAPGITLGLGLGIGRLVFGALNRIEIVFTLLIWALCFLYKPSRSTWIVLSVISVIILIQSLWLLPVLDERAQLIIDGKTPAPNSPHIYYILAEALKIIFLLTIPWISRKNFTHKLNTQII
jgi:hypothetical protein